MPVTSNTDPHASQAPRRPRVVLADDYQRLLDAWRRLLEPTCDIIAAVPNGRGAVEAAETLHPDVIVLDFTLPDINGVEACRQIKRLSPETRVLLVTAADDPSLQTVAHRAGASGFILKFADPEDLIRAVHDAYADH